AGRRRARARRRRGPPGPRGRSRPRRPGWRDGSWLSPLQEGTYLGIVRRVAELLRVAERHLGARLGVEEDGAVADREDARELGSRPDERGAEALPQLEDRVVEAPRAERIEAGGGLAEKHPLGIERHGPRQAGAFAHPAADLGRVEILEARQPDERQLERDEI